MSDIQNESILSNNLKGASESEFNKSGISKFDRRFQMLTFFINSGFWGLELVKKLEWFNWNWASAAQIFGWFRSLLSTISKRVRKYQKYYQGVLVHVEGPTWASWHLDVVLGWGRAPQKPIPSHIWPRKWTNQRLVSSREPRLHSRFYAVSVF